MIKKDQNNPIPESLYAESNAVCYFRAIYYGINMNKREKKNGNIPPLTKPLKKTYKK